MGKWIISFISLSLLPLTCIQSATYTYSDVFTIDVPDVFELRVDSGKYSLRLDSLQLINPNCEDCIVFQQAGLNNMKEGSTDVYARILITVVEDKSKPFLSREAHPKLSSSDKYEYRKLCDRQKMPFDYVYEPQFDWINIYDNVWAIRMIYARTGLEGNVLTNIYLLQDKSFIVMIVTAYRVQEFELWSDSVDKTLKSFQWIKPQSNNISLLVNVCLTIILATLISYAIWLICKLLK